MRIPSAKEREMVEREVELALKGYEKVVSAEELAVIRSCVRDALLFHPDGQDLVRLATDEPVVDRSGTVSKERDREAATVATPANRKRGRRS